MRKLTFTEKYSLEILRRLKRRLVLGDVCYKNYKKEGRRIGIEAEFIASDLGLPLTPKKIEYIGNVIQLLQNKGLDIKVTSDFANVLRSALIDKDHPIEDSTQLGIIRSENDQSILEKLDEILIELRKGNMGNNGNKIIEKKKSLKSIYLITESIVVKDVIYLVIDEEYKTPIRFKTKNTKGEETYIKKLHNIVYCCNAPGKMVSYDKGLADDINNGLFKRRQIKKYMETNDLKKPTLVQKSEDKKTLVPKNEIFIKTMLKNTVPSQYQYLYEYKTK